MKHPQFTLDLSRPVDYSPSAFAKSPSNAAAAQMIADWPRWPGPVVCLMGPGGCGKSHLGAIWSEVARATALSLADLADDHIKGGMTAPLWIDREKDGASFDETTLFHALNMAREEGSFILLTARQAPSKWQVALPDLASRLKALPVVEIWPPDDALIEAILIKLFADIGVEADASVMRFLLARMERSYGAAAAVAHTFDQRTLAAHRRATVPLATQVLEELDATRA